MPTWLLLIITAAAVVAIFLTTPRGRQLAQSVGADALLRGGPSRDDRAYLLRACGGDSREVARLLEAERALNPALSETDVYRRAIRTHMNSPAAKAERDREWSELSDLSVESDQSELADDSDREET